MANLKLLELGGVKNSLDDLEDDAFTVDNRVGNAQKVANDNLDADTPKGLLAGSLVSMKGSRTIGGCDGTSEVPVGFLINDVAGNAFENTPAVASGKGPYMHAGGEIEIDVFESRNQADSADLTYAVGDLVYASQNGLVTNENPTTFGAFVPPGRTDAVAVALVKKVPTASDPFLGLQLLI